MAGAEKVRHGERLALAPSGTQGGGIVVEDRIQEIERYVRHSMRSVAAPDLKIAHGFEHVDRVRRWALHIARSEAIQELGLVGGAALLHDIGLTRVQVGQRSQHGQVGAEIAAQFLHKRRLFGDEEIRLVADAIRCHSAAGGGGWLGALLRDADKLDALGAVGIMRAFTSKHALPEYDPENVRGETWGMTMQGV
jgi:uncharacterized protein